MASDTLVSMFSGQFYAIISAVLFGISPALSKLVIGTMSPALLAGLLYLGSGIGLQFLLALQHKNLLQELRQLSRRHRLKLAGAIIFGGILAPLCLAYGIKYGTASEVSLLLNLETVATTVIAWLLFKEHVGSHVWAGKALILFGAAIITLRTGETFAFSIPGLLVILACFLWGMDNNLTRDVEELSAPVLACVKGLAAGVFNTLLALTLFPTGASVFQTTGCLTIGAMSYGLSLVLFIEALRRIGSARTSTLFAIGPYAGTILSVFLLGEHPPPSFWLAALIMLAGTGFLYREFHAHVHNHLELSHRHAHVHDEHHRHVHEGLSVGEEPHDHFHTHELLTHYHVHWPDIHHRHIH
jgi:drug/metabolite transporter (DMT)-like permease